MSDESKIECRTCPVCKNPFLRTDQVIGWRGGFHWTIRGGSVCENCQDKMRSGIENGTGLTGIWFDDQEKNHD